MKIPIENYYKDFQFVFQNDICFNYFILNYNYSSRRQYPPLSLYQLQLMIENGIVDPDLPIDLATLCNSQFYSIDPLHHHYGVNLTDEGINNFKYKINIEVQHTTEPVIAKIEKNGGQIITAYFDKKSVSALANPMEFFKKGFF